MQNPDTEVRPLMTAAEVAIHYRVTVRTVRNWMAKGLLVPVRRGRTVRFRAEDIIVGREERVPKELG